VSLLLGGCRRLEVLSLGKSLIRSDGPKQQRLDRLLTARCRLDDIRDKKAGSADLPTGARSVTRGNASSRPPIPPRAGPGGEFGPQLTAFFTSARICASSAGVNFVSAKAVDHMAPSSRFAASWKPSVEYLELYCCALWKKQTTLPSLA
jgi:hypothetical protein